MIRIKPFTICGTLAVFFFAACGPTSVSNNPTYGSLSSPTLWYELGAATDTKQIMLIEAELASRGESRSGAQYIGQKTSSTIGKSLYARSGQVSGDKNCSDFSSASAAQNFFLASGGPTNDPHGLDGNACEWGSTLRTSVANYKGYLAQQASIERQSQVASRCYVGPRGGTYTITSNGQKNYDGC